MDNLAPHCATAVRELIEHFRCRLILLPPYSPEYNPMEEALSKIKHFMAEVCPRTLDALMAAFYDATSRVTPQDAVGWFGDALLEWWVCQPFRETL